MAEDKKPLDPLLDLLVQNGVLDDAQVETILEEAKNPTGKTLRQILIDGEYVTEDDLLGMMAAYQGCDVVNLSDMTLDTDTVQSIPTSVARMYNVLAVASDETSVTLATSDLIDPRASDELAIRRTAFKSCIDELLWIWQKKSNNIHDLKSHIWDSWADENGSIGKAYGYQLAKKSVYPEGEFDQVDRVLFDLKHNPQSRRIMTNIYNFEDLHEMNLYPCAYSMTFNVTGDTLNGILNQRSNDMLTANNWNVVQYAILLMMLAQVSGLKAGTLVHVIADAHIYDRHVDLVKEVIAKPQHPAPKVKINPNVKNFYDFKVEDFELEGYEYEKLDKKIPVAV